MYLLQENMHPECWVTSFDQDGLAIHALRDDISVTIVEMPKEDDNDVSNEFTERFINKKASLHYYSLKFNGSTVKNTLLFMVDGGRAYIPSPKLIDRNYIQDDNLIVSVIIDRITFENRYQYEDTTNYLDRAKLTYQKSVIK